MIRKKGISPLIAAVLLIAFTMAIASLAGPWFSQVITESQGDTSQQASDIQNAAELNIDIISSEYDSSSGLTTITIQNRGSRALENITLTGYGENVSQTTLNSRIGPGEIATKTLAVENPDEVTVESNNLPVSSSGKVKEVSQGGTTSPYFNITDYTSDPSGDWLNITVDVKNIGTQTGTQDVIFYKQSGGGLGGTTTTYVENYTDLTLSPGAEQNGIEFAAEANCNSYEWFVETQDANVSGFYGAIC